MTPEAANVVNVAIEGYYKILEISPKALPALENYGNASSRVQATRLALEGVKETAKTIWEGIKAYIKKIIDWIMAQYNKVFGAAEKLAKRAEALKTRADAELPARPKETSIVNATVAAGVHVGGSVSDISAGIATVAAMTKAVLGKTFESTTAQMEGATESLEAGAASGDFSKVVSTPLVPEGIKAKPAESIGYKAPAEGLAFGVSEEFPGGQVIAAYYPSKKASGKDAMALFTNQSIKVGPASQAANKPKAPEKFNTMTPDQCKAAAGSVEEMAAELKAFRNKASKIKAVADKALKAADDLSKASEKETEVTRQADYKAAGKALTASVRIVSELQHSWAGYALNTAKHTLDAVELSVKQYEAAKA